MTRNFFLLLCLLAELFSTVGMKSGAQNTQSTQNDQSNLRVNVVLVQLSVAVTDNQGNYVSGLKPEDFIVTEDKIQEKLATFEEGNEPTISLIGGTSTVASSATPAGTSPNEVSSIARAPGSNIFVLFDTSNYMYRGFVFAQDAIADFVRSLEGVGNVALYSYSRNLSRISGLTPDRSQVLHAVRSTVAGDDAALYNSLLLTVKDAAPLTGKKAIVVFSNGPDNASLVPPEDVAELAQSTGTIIYMISTQQAIAEPVSTAVFERMSKATGGKAYFSRDWKDEAKAFASIRDDLAHLYSLSYYPQANANRGWRAITVKLAPKNMQKYHIRTRDGYRILRQTQTPTDSFSSSAAASE